MDIKERAELVKQWATENHTPIQELCPELNQYMKMKDGYEMWNSRTHERWAINYNPTTWKATSEHCIVNKVCTKSDYMGLYVRYIEELDAMEFSYVIMEGGRGKDGEAKLWKYYGGYNYSLIRYFFFHNDKNVYTYTGVICTPSVGGRYNKDVYDEMHRYNLVYTDRTNMSEFNKFAPDIDLPQYCRWNGASNIWWSPDITYYAHWYKKDFVPKEKSSNAVKLESYELEDVDFKMLTASTRAMYYQQLDGEMAVLRFFEFPRRWAGHGENCDNSGYVRVDGTKVEKARLYVSSKGKPTLMVKEAGVWIIKASVPWDVNYEPEVVNREEMETWKPLKYILPCLEDITIQNIVDYLRHPIIEQLYKSGYQNLTKRVQQGHQIKQTLKYNFCIENETKQPLYKMLGVNKFVLNVAEQYNNLRIVRELKFFYDQFDISHCPEDIAQKFGKMIGNDYYTSVTQLIPRNNNRYYYRIDNRYETPLTDDQRKWILKLMRMEDKYEGCIQVYKDVISTYHRINNKPDIDLCNLHSYEDINRLHDALVALQVREEAEREAVYNASKREQLEKAQKTFEKLQKERIEKFEYEDDKWCIRVPHELNEITKEGVSLHHCVGGYLERHANGYTNILFLRRKGEENISFFTIEINNSNQVVQIHGSHNRWLGNEPDAVPFMYKYLTQLGAKFDKNLLLNKGAGYSPSAESLDESYLQAA